MAHNRRQFLHNGCKALTATALLSGLGRFALVDALAQTNAPADYKALVCIFLFGGNDANNVVIPHTNYADYEKWRPRPMNNFAIPFNDLLQITPPSHASQGAFGLNPKLGDSFDTNPSIKGLWDLGKAAVVCNTGPLIRPITRSVYRAGGNGIRPYQLFSHSDQQNIWQTAYATGSKQTGWGGSTADRTGGSGGNFPAISSIAGVTVFSTGLNTRPLVLAGAPSKLGDSLHLLRTTDQQAVIDALTADGLDPMPTLIKGAADITQKALDVSNTLGQADPTVNTLFPNNSLGNQLKQIAKIISFIKSTPSLGVKRQIFFASMGGFDTHTNQGNYIEGNPAGSTGGQLGLLSQISQAVGSLYRATVELNLEQNVTIFTSSDFSRTFVPGGGNTGTDHAWGSHQFVVGGAVNGGDFYGTYPSLVVGTDNPPDDVSVDTDNGSGARGRWVPTTSVDQYAATLATWYGLSPSDLGIVFPNLSNFTVQNLGFV